MSRVEKAKNWIFPSFFVFSLFVFEERQKKSFFAILYSMIIQYVNIFVTQNQ